MENKLIIGGLYSLSNIPNTYFVYLKENSYDELYFFEVKTEFSDLKNVIDEVIPDISYESKSILFERILSTDKQFFLRNYSGFLGSVPDWILKKMLELEKD